MTTPKTRKGAAHPTQGAVPTPADEGPAVAPAPAQVPAPVPAPVPMPEPEADMPLMVAENAVYKFKPGAGMTALDLRELLLMQLMQLVNGPEVEKGALRGLTLQGHRFDQLSDNTQRWFEAVTPPAPTGEEAIPAALPEA